MYIDYLINKKINALLEYEGEYLDETDEIDYKYYCKMKNFARKHGGLLYFFDNNFYFVLNFTDGGNFLIIPTEYKI